MTVILVNPTTRAFTAPTPIEERGRFSQTCKDFLYRLGLEEVQPYASLSDIDGHRRGGHRLFKIKQEFRAHLCSQ